MAKRITKKPEERRAEILAVAKHLFESKGYEETSVDEIVNAIGVAKGTFYYYFKSKEDILDAMVKQMSQEMLALAEVVVADPTLSAVEKICTIISQQNAVVDKESLVFEGFHRPENKALHERNNIEVVLAFGPVLAKVVEQGKKDKIFQVDDALSTIQFILAGSLFLLGEGIFNWTDEEKTARTMAMLVLMERALGAESGILVNTLGRVVNHGH